MTRWKEDTKEFDVSISTSKNRDGSESQICRIPKQVTERLGNPKKLKFKLGQKGGITVSVGDKK